MAAVWLVLGILVLIATLLFLVKRVGALAAEDALFMVVAFISGILLILHGVGSV